MNTVDKQYLLYCHKNNTNGKLYFGITSTSLYMRFRKNGRGYYGQVFGRAIQKYGWSNFEHIVLIEGLSLEVAAECEKFLIAKYQTNNPQYGYNVTDGGEGNKAPRSEESNLKRSMSESGEKHWHYGKHWSKEVRKKFHKPHPSVSGENSPSKRPEVRKKLSEKHKEWWKEHPDFHTTKGQPCKQETKLKISRANYGSNNANYGKRWYNDGVKSVMAYECPDGFTLGRLMKGKING